VFPSAPGAGVPAAAAVVPDLDGGGHRRRPVPARPPIDSKGEQMIITHRSENHLGVTEGFTRHIASSVRAASPHGRGAGGGAEGGSPGGAPRAAAGAEGLPPRRRPRLCGLVLTLPVPTELPFPQDSVFVSLLCHHCRVVCVVTVFQVKFCLGV